MWNTGSFPVVSGGSVTQLNASCFALSPTFGSKYTKATFKIGDGGVDMSRAVYATVAIENTGQNDTYAWLLLKSVDTSNDAQEWMRHALVLKAGESIDFQFYLPRIQTFTDGRIFVEWPDTGISSKYGYISGVPAYFTTKWGQSYSNRMLEHIDEFVIRIGEPLTSDRPSSLRVCNLRIRNWDENSIYLRRTDYSESRIVTKSTETTFFPWIDVFGQKMYGEWPGRVSQHSDFQQHKIVETTWLENKQGPSGWDAFGGYMPGIRYTATGHFRTEKISGKWWFIDPLGHPFFSVGITGIGHDGGNSPHFHNGVNRTMWQERCTSARVPYKMKTQCGRDAHIRFFEEAIAYKHGFMDPQNPSDFNTSLMDDTTDEGYNNTAKYYDMIIARLKKWGINTHGAWSVWGLNAHKMQNKSYGIDVGVRVPYTFFINSGFKPDQLPTNITNYITTNMLGKISNMDATLARLGTSLNDDPYCIGVYVDNEMNSNHEETIFRKYFQAVKHVMDTRLNNKLWLCNRWSGIPSAGLLNISADFCDVVSYNWYHNEANEEESSFPTVANYTRQQVVRDSSGREKPTIIGEFTISTFDAANVASGPRHASTDRQRGRIVSHYIKTALNTPSIVGTTFFRWADQYLTGRRDGESYQNGFVTTLDHPYYDFLDEVTNLTYYMYEPFFGSSSQPPIPPLPPLPPYPPPLPCESWCAGHTQVLIDKCTYFAKCKGCHECMNLQAPPVASPQAPPSVSPSVPPAVPPPIP